MKAQISFDMGVAVIAIALIIFFGFFILLMLNTRTVTSLKEESAYNHLLAYSDYLIKDKLADRSFQNKTVYHHSISDDNCSTAYCTVPDYLGFEEIRYGLSDMGDNSITGMLCIRRVVESNGDIKMLVVCGDY